MSEATSPPPTRAEAVVESLHGVEVRDPYRWLEDTAAPEVRAWVEAQNAHTRAVLAIPSRDRLAARLDALLATGGLGTPVPVKGRLFHARRDGRQDQAVLYVRDSPTGPDRPLIDPNALSAEGTVALDWWYPSRDGNLLAFGLSRDGSEQSTLYVRDVSTSADLPDTIDRTRACALAWLPDASGFYYTRYPAPGSVPAGEEAYHRRVYFHRLGASPNEDEEVFGRGRAKEDWLDVRLSPDGRWLVVGVSQGWARTEVYFKDRQDPQTAFVPLARGVEALYHVTPRADHFYVHTNEGAARYRLFRVDPLRPARSEWVELVPEGEDVLEGVAAVGGQLLAEYSVRATSRLRWFDGDGKFLREVHLPGVGSLAGMGAEWDGAELYFSFQSVTVPPSAYRLDLQTGAVTLWRRVEVEIDLDAYELSQETYRSYDGTPVDVFLASRKGLPRDGNNPTILYGYGGFNISLTPSFSAARFAFLERGGLLAIANLRGGGERGEEWHRAGMLGNKQNVFDDFLACAEWLIAERYTRPERLAIMGGSNGGLLVGAAITQRPELFRAAICSVPLLDMVRYHRFLLARLWVPEYGCADNPEQFRWLYAYSPYHRVRDGVAYPAVLLATAESDTRVDALHARKMAARLQAASPSGRPVLLRLEAKAGHGAGKPRGKVVEEVTDVYAFVFRELGVEV
jgi:prolyl oligopeptidase